MKKLKVQPYRIESLFIQLKKQIRVAEMVGLSRERVRQILRDSTDQKVISLLAEQDKIRKFGRAGESCSFCKRKFVTECKYGGLHLGRDVCVGCKSWMTNRSQAKNPRARRLIKIKSFICIDCGVVKARTKSIKPRHGRCNHCNHIYKKATDPGYLEMRRKSHYQYYERHQEKIRSYFREWTHKNKEKVLARVRAKYAAMTPRDKKELLKKQYQRRKELIEQRELQEKL